MKSGVLPLKNKDRRDYDAWKSLHPDVVAQPLLGSVILSTIPKRFSFDRGLTMPDQNADGLYQACTAYTSSDIYTNETGKSGDPLTVYKKTMEIMGIKPNDPRYLKVPCDIKSAYKAAQQIYGFGPYFNILENNPFDSFDGIRMIMWTQKRPASIGTPWLKEWENPQSGVITENFIYDPSTWHNYEYTGQEEINGIEYLVAKSWQGRLFGDKGVVYFPRSVINKSFAAKGTFAYTFPPPENVVGEIKTVTLPWWQELLSQLIVFLKSLTKPKVDAPQAIVETVPEPPLPPAPTEEKPKYLWDTKENAVHSCRLLMDEYNLTWASKAALCATIEGESNFNTQAKNENKKDGKVWSTDWGICQINDYYHIGIGKEFSSVEEVLNNPEKSVRYMIEMYQRGHLDYWNAFKSGYYKKFLDKYLARN